MKFVGVRELKNNTSEILHYTATSGYVVVTSRGKPCAIMSHISDNELEDYVLLNHPEIRKRIKKAYKEYLAGKTKNVDKLIKKAERDLAKIHR